MDGYPCYHDILDSSEAILLEYDPQKLSFSDILNMWSTNFAFFRSKPSKRQYRQILFVNSDEERAIATAKIRVLEQTSQVYVSVEPVATFYRAEEHHQDFFLKSRAKIAEANLRRDDGPS